MKVVLREVFYCEFCKRHRLTKSAIEKHEPRCIYNPGRHVCGWHDDKVAIGDAGLLAAEYKQTLDTEWLRREVGGCPACMLAVVVQADLTVHEREDCGFDYRAEVERFRKEEGVAYGF
jgi:hypothetical protein